MKGLLNSIDDKYFQQGWLFMRAG